MSLTICDWKHGKSWVYSVTYDEALDELHRYAVPFHEELGIPGHVEAVAGHIGQVRQLGQSSYNGFHHMGPDGLRDLVERGWGVGNHTWSHELVRPDNVDVEIGRAKEVLEEACGSRVPLYCAAGNNANMSAHVLAACRKYGYLGAMSITDALNRPGDELFWLNRTPLHEQFYEPFFSEYDPYRNIRHAQAERGWIIDYCHCPLEEAVHPNKDCSAAHLRQRFETVLAEGRDDVWCANPDEVIDYHRTRRHTRVETVRETGDERAYRLRFDGLPEQVACRALTIEVDAPAAWCRDPVLRVDRQEIKAELVRPGRLRATVEARDGLEVAALARPAARPAAAETRGESRR
ncbi:MAG: polysaccharide deacetylase family protein [Chthonomonadales bacterium]|nr:polysaccharide deacetylase family protein [Chthonomonadales bacterium]